MHEVIRRVKDEAASVVAFDTADNDLNAKQKKAIKNNKAAKLIDGLIDRGVVKRTVMTSVYGVTYIGARQQIQEKIEEKVSWYLFFRCTFCLFSLFTPNVVPIFISVERERIRY